tara:strand:- start:236 stop:361 length:126 start_codon:yes stop_codon:yes gene_type:complete
MKPTLFAFVATKLQNVTTDKRVISKTVADVKREAEKKFPTA